MKRNHRNLHRQLAALPWQKASAQFYDRTAAHGRLETRVVRALSITDLGVGFPHAVQVAKIVRHRTQRKTGKRGRETVYVITDLTSREASPSASRRSSARSGSPPAIRRPHEHRGRTPRDALRQLLPTTESPRALLTSTHARSKVFPTASAGYSLVPTLA
ncbi:hypothetical protein [Streptomyces sp. NBC_00038]|uniref:hypothetical protein n=1 Tax=Streptomyces sp. NBC_00038 TaxID=2903615 RepID=UPI002250ECEE|nr:hypothetical protein [Streptomyces sp. NBC_00038]MCX5561939.1 hypothetical protein [Streptomyces sp. NBC_00038]